MIAWRRRGERARRGQQLHRPAEPPHLGLEAGVTDQSRVYGIVREEVEELVVESGELHGSRHTNTDEAVTSHEAWTDELNMGRNGDTRSTGRAGRGVPVCRGSGDGRRRAPDHPAAYCFPACLPGTGTNAHHYNDVYSTVMGSVLIAIRSTEHSALAHAP
jgi:hypothetical protein